MNSLQKIDIELDKLLVNPENYRFNRVTDQQEAILTMLHSQNNKIIRLARDIAQRGLNPTKRLVVKEADDSRYVVLEGNRRVTVLKLINNPNEIPGDYLFKSIFEDLHAKYKNSLPTTVECVVYPEDQQEIADSWVLLEHTGENQGMGTVPWNSVQKQRFESRHKQKELSKSLQVLEFMEGKGIDTSGIEATNLERLISTPAVRQELGIDFPNKQLLLTEPEQDVFQKLEKVVQHMRAKDFVVGHIYKVEQRLEWVKKVLAQKPSAPNSPKDISTSPPDSSSINTNTNNNTNTNIKTSAFAPNPAPQPSPTPKPPKDDTNMSKPTAHSGNSNTPTSPQPSPSSSSNNQNSYQTLINPAKSLPATTPAKIAEIYKELQTVALFGSRAAPHAVGALLRILVEVTAQEYLMKTQKFYYDSSSNFRNPADPSKTYREVRDKLNYIITNCGLPGHIAQVLRTLTGQQLMTAELNQVMHSTLFTASGTSIKELWKNFEKVFDHLINEIQ